MDGHKTNPRHWSNLGQHFADEDKARELLEAMRWPAGPPCPVCGLKETVYRMQRMASSRKPGRKGLLRCRACKKQFTVTTGTVFEDSHIPLTKWLQAIYLLSSSKKGMSAHQLHRMLGITYKAAWFMAHRLRYAMSVEPFASKLAGTVEVALFVDVRLPIRQLALCGGFQEHLTYQRKNLSAVTVRDEVASALRRRTELDRR